MKLKFNSCRITVITSICVLKICLNNNSMPDPLHSQNILFSIFIEK